MLSHIPKVTGISLITWSLVFFGSLIITGIIYFQGLYASIQFDDEINLRGLDKIHDFTSAKEFILGGIAGPLGRPLALLTFALQYYAWPTNPELLIEWNIFLHLFNGVLVTTLALNLGGAVFTEQTPALRTGILTGSLWLLLPILTSSSLFIIQRMTTLSAAFTLIGLIFYTRLRLQALNKPERYLIKFSIIVIAFTALAAFSKENGILLPMYILTIEATLFFSSRYHSEHAAWRIWKAIFLYSPLCLIVGYLLLRLPYSDATVLQRGFTATERIASQGYILWLYLFRAFLPTPSSLGPFHDTLWNFDLYQLSLGLILFTCLFILGTFCFRNRKQQPLLAFACLWYLLGHLLESTTFHLELYFEHRNYIPIIGPIFALLAFLSSLQAWKKSLSLFVYAYIALMGLVTYMTTSLWGQPLVAAEIWAMENPKSVRATLHLAKQLELNHDLGAALHVMDRFNINHPDSSLGLQIQALKLACVLDPTGNHNLRLNDLIKNASSARYENWAVSQPEDFHGWLLKNQCKAITFNTVNSIVDAMTSNSGYASNPMALHNLYILKGIIALQYEEITDALQNFDTALSHHIGKDILEVALKVAETHKKTEFIDKWSYAAK